VLSQVKTNVRGSTSGLFPQLYTATDVAAAWLACGAAPCVVAACAASGASTAASAVTDRAIAAERVSFMADTFSVELLVCQAGAVTDS